MKFYRCVKCGYVKTALVRKRSMFPLLCPHCWLDTSWAGPYDDKTHTLSGRRFKPSKSP